MFVYYRDRSENGEGNKQGRSRKYMCKVTKHASKKMAKTEANLN